MPVFRTFCLMLCIASVLAGCGSPPASAAEQAWVQLRTRCRVQNLPGRLAGGDSAALVEQAGAPCSALDVRLAVATLEQEASARPSALSSHRAAVAAVIAGEPRRAIGWFERVTASETASADAWNDLAVAYLLLAGREGGADDYVRALDAACRALEIAPPMAEAAHNRAVAERALGPDVPSAEQREDRVSLLAKSSLDGLRTDAPPDLLAEVIERHWMGQWAQAVSHGDTSGARRMLEASRAAAQVIVSRGGDTSVAALVGELGDASGRKESPAARAAAWQCYLDATAVFERDDVAGAGRRLRQLPRPFPRVGPAVEARLLLLESAIDRVNGDPAGALRAMRTDVSGGFAAFPVLDARRRWQTGLILAEAGQIGDAHSDYRAAQTIFARTGERESEAMVSSLLASGYADLQDWAQSWHHQTRANANLAFCRRLRRESVRTNAALIASAMGLYRAATTFRAPAIAAANAVGSASALAFLLTDEALDRNHRGDTATALRLLDEAAAAARTITDRGTSEMFQALDASTRGAVLTSSDPDQAQAHFARAVQLYRARGSEFGTPEALLQRGRILQTLGRLDDAERVFRDGLQTTQAQEHSLPSPARGAELRSARWELYRGLASVLFGRNDPWSAFEVIEEGRRGRPRLARAPSGALSPNAAGGADTVWVSYLDLGTRVVAWSVAGQDRDVYSVAQSTEQLTAAVDRLRAALQGGVTSAPESVSLFAAMLGPIARRLDGATRLVVCGDGALMRLPFAALSERVGGPLLFERVAVVNAPSCRPEPGRPARRAGAATAVVIAGDPERVGATRLPRAREEAVAVAGFYPGATLALGGEANRGRLRALLPRAEIFHFAGHAVAHPGRQSLSRLLLSPSDGDVDGALYASEIEAMTLSARLVVLAACDTAAGVPRAGAGVMGLADAFLTAGAHAVVATQWPVADADAAPFFVELHRQLAGGAAVPAALRATQAWARTEGLSAALWSAVIAIGTAG